MVSDSPLKKAGLGIYEEGGWVGGGGGGGGCKQVLRSNRENYH